MRRLFAVTTTTAMCGLAHALLTSDYQLAFDIDRTADGRAGEHPIASNGLGPLPQLGVLPPPASA